MSLPIRPPEPNESKDSYNVIPASSKNIDSSDYLDYDSYDEEELPDFFNSELPNIDDNSKVEVKVNTDSLEENILDTSGDYDEEDLDRELGLLDDFENLELESEINSEDLSASEEKEEVLESFVDSNNEDTSEVDIHDSEILKDDLEDLLKSKDSELTEDNEAKNYNDSLEDENNSSDLSEDDDEEELDLNALIESLNVDEDPTEEDQTPVKTEEKVKEDLSSDEDTVVFSDSDDDDEEDIDFDFLDSLIEDTDDEDSTPSKDEDVAPLKEDSNFEDTNNSSEEFKIDDEHEDEDFSLELQEALGSDYKSSEYSQNVNSDRSKEDREDSVADDTDWDSLLDDIGISMDDSSENEPSISEEMVDESSDDEQLPDFGLDAIRDSHIEDSNQDSSLSEEEEDFSYDEEEFTPPENPFALPDESNFNEEDNNADSDSNNNSSFDESEEEFTKSSNSKDNKNPEEDKRESVLLKKLSSLFDAAALKLFLSNYLDSVKAEMQGKDAPKPKTKINEPEEDEAEENEEEFDGNESLSSKSSGGKKRGKKRSSLPNIFGFLTPIKKLYLFVVNLFFKILTTILGILSKLPIVGRLISPILGMTKLLQQLANYLPIVVLIGALVLTSFLSIPREHTIELPDSGGATFNNFKYDSQKQVAKGTIVNTGEVIATVETEFTVMTLQPELMNPKSWIIPQEVFKCNGDYTSVDIDSEEKVEVKCSSKKELPGYFPRVVGKISE